MALPGNITTVTVTGTYTNPDGTPASGAISFTPSSALTDRAGTTILTAAPVTATLSSGAFSVVLPCTNNPALQPNPFQYTVVQAITYAAQTYQITLPVSLGSTVDIASLAPVPAQPSPTGGIYVISVNGESGQVAVKQIDGVTVTGTPTTGQVLTATSGTAAGWSNAASGGITPPAGDIGGSTGTPTVVATHLTAPLPVAQGGTGSATTSTALSTLGGAAVAGDLGGTSASPQVTGTHLGSPLPVAQGGTGQATASTALSALGGAAVAGDLGGTSATPQVTATHLGTPLPTGQGGTGAASQQAAINALTGSQVSGRYLRSDGANASLTTIQAGDVPTLNQSTTGTAAGLSVTLAVGSGGTGQTTQQAAIDALTGTQSAGKVLRSDGTHATLAAIQAGDVPTLNQNTSGTAAALSSTLAVTSGGTGDTSLTAYALLTGGTTSTGAVQSLAGVGSSGQVLTSNGASALPTFQAAGAASTPNVPWLPADNGYLVASVDPALLGAGFTPTNGKVYLVALQIRQSVTVTKISWQIQNTASGSSTGTFTGLYSSAGSIIASATSADVGANFTPGGGALGSTPVICNFGASQSLTAGTVVIAALVLNLTGVPTMFRTTSGVRESCVVGQTNPAWRAASYATASQTSLPSSLGTVNSEGSVPACWLF